MNRRVLCLWLAGVAAMGLVVTYSRGIAQTRNDPGTVKLVVRADDIGSCHTANLACIKCYQEGIVIEHPGLDTPEMQAMGHKGYREVASHRDGVTKSYTSSKVKETIKTRGIELASYHDIWLAQP